MKVSIAFFISAFAIPTKRPWTEKRYYQEIEPLKTEIQHDENIEEELFPLIFNSTYSQQHEFRNEIAEMKTLEVILNGNVYLSDTDEYENYNDTYSLYHGSYDLSGIQNDINGNDFEEYRNYYFREDRNMDSNQVLVFVAILVFVMVLFFTIILCCLRKKGKLNDKTKPTMNSKPKIKFAKIASSKAIANVQEIKVGDYTMLCYKS